MFKSIVLHLEKLLPHMLYYFNTTLYVQAENMSLSCLSLPYAIVKGLWVTVNVFKIS